MQKTVEGLSSVYVAALYNIGTNPRRYKLEIQKKRTLGGRTEWNGKEIEEATENESMAQVI